jgi:DNA-binding CsgD family transcriptional regulator
LSSPEIASHLHLSVRTVDTHLTHVFTKLGVNRRSALAAALAGLQTPQP